ncbi:ankyrin repeat-containing protein [Legionella steigerwaltii]|uniref:Ankyrin repeat-containing protein n=1 Tax=Legionella steigerwaltii TaxID=460 RepID=A0A378L4D8_9GAMM|nr:Dot/Icm T4SS effector AnkG/AnkZ/LegA7 [Legionella steigerwaltii]KTD71978.1 ankyrin repeat-containing protein [Legionella steigerwaltii]STY21644.1 ankyrin repeat-containing protein [Legionella steigerwaltii]
MIYVLYLLLLVSLLIVLQRKFISFNQLIPALSYVTSKRNALEHEDLLTLFEKFNYEHGEGVCHGFTLTWAQEAALGIEHQFYNRLNLIKKEKETLPHTLHAITEKIKSSQMLSKKERRLNEIKPFLETICLAQSPDDYAEVYAQTIQQSDIDIIYKIIQLNLCRNQNTVKNLFSKTMSLASPREVNGFLNQLNDLLATKNQVVVVCSSEEHTVGFKKHKDNTWLFMDINHLYEQTEEYPYHLLTSDELVPILCKSLFETSERLVFHCSFIAKTGHRKLTQHIQALDELYPIDSKNIQISNCRGYGTLALAVQNDDRNTVREILRLHKKSPVISQPELEHALFYAAACNRSYIMNQLKNIPKIDINGSCDLEGNSPLGVACKYGNEDVVQLLLRDDCIAVNLQSTKERMTPLMLACKSSYTQKKPALFEMLLAAGANAALTNINEETAYDIAKEHNNQTGLQIMGSHDPKSNPQPSSNESHKLLSGKSKSGTMVSSYSFLKKRDKSIPQEDRFKQTETQKLHDEQINMLYP